MKRRGKRKEKRDGCDCDGGYNLGMCTPIDCKIHIHMESVKYAKIP